MARPSYKDPLPAFRFYVLVDDFGDAGFFEVTPPSVTVSKKEYHEGGAIQAPHVSVDRVSFRNITLRRGVTTNADFADWVTKVFTETADKGKVTNFIGKTKQGLTKAASGLAEDTISNVVGETLGGGWGPMAGGIAGGLIGKLIRRSWGAGNYRKNMTIVQLDRSGVPVKSWRVYNAFPVSYEPFDGYNSTNSKIAIETVELAYEGFELVGETELKDILESGLYDSMDTLINALGF